MPKDYVFGGKRDEMAKAIDRDLAMNTGGPIRPVRESDLGDRTDMAIARGALGGRHTTGKLPEKRFAINRPKETYEQVPPDRKVKRFERRIRPSVRKPLERKGGR
jgi:hypothetical protein